MEGYLLRGGKGRMGEKVQGFRSIIGRYKIDREVKNSMGNGEAKELICMTQGHELRCRNAGESGMWGSLVQQSSPIHLR